MLSEFGTSRYYIRTDGENADKSALMVFDERGQLVSPGKLPSHITNELLTVFNGFPKAVCRSSGGLILVHPSHLVIVTQEKSPMDVRVKVLFQELERNSQHRVISKKIITSSKTVPLSEIKAGFSYESSRNQNFVIDMGLGIIPIHVLSFYEDSQGITWAAFVRHDEIEKAILASISSQISIFEVPQNLLRSIDSFSTNGQKDFQWAKEHVQRLIERGESIIPESLLLTAPVNVPPGLSFTELNHYLLSRIEEKKVHQTDASYFLSNTEHPESELLLPMNENPD
ncbi:MAG: hypothetical protein ACKN9V_01655 [Pseudomonadota bacterium]